MDVKEKVKVLNMLDTKRLVENLHKYEEELQKAMVDQADFKGANHGYLSGSGDCQEVKKILAELAVQAPDKNDDGKKTTQADKDAWLIRQRNDNKDLNDAITRQLEVVFLLNDHEIKVEMAKRRLNGATAVLALRTQQIAFLAS